jgi:hypothetical protein
VLAFPLQGGVAYLPDLSVTGSSEAILQGQKPPFRLMARAVSAADGSRAVHIRPAISEAFVVRCVAGAPPLFLSSWFAHSMSDNKATANNAYSYRAGIGARTQGHRCLSRPQTLRASP